MATTVTGTGITLSFYTDYQLGYQLGGAEISMGCDSNFYSKPLFLSLWHFPFSVYACHVLFPNSYTEVPLDLPGFMSDSMFSFVFFSSVSLQVRREGILQLSLDHFQLEESRCIAWILFPWAMALDTLLLGIYVALLLF